MTRFWAFLRHIITNNFWLKLISVVFALSFYGFIHSAENAQRTVQVKLVIEKPPESTPRRLMSDIPPSVDVTLVGPLQQLESLGSDELSITLNLAAAESIPQLKLTEDMIPGLPPRITVDRIYPSRLEILFEDVITREVPVQVARTGTPAKGMEVSGKTIVEPERIMATGIRSRIETIQFARAEAFDVSDLDEGLEERQLRLDEPPEGVTFDHESVKATVQIAIKLAVKEFDKVEVSVAGMPANAKTKPKTIHVVLTGPPDDIERLKQEHIVPIVKPFPDGQEIPATGTVEGMVVVDLPNVQVDLSHTRVLVIW